MGRKKKAVAIDEELQESTEKVEAVASETDINTVDTEADNITGMTLEIYHKDYTVQELEELRKKDNKTYSEKEIVNRYVELMYNYYRGIKHAILRDCCGQTYSIADVKSKLNKEEAYKIIDIRCSRKTIRFDKTTVDTIISFIEEYEKE